MRVYTEGLGLCERSIERGALMLNRLDERYGIEGRPDDLVGGIADCQFRSWELALRLAELRRIYENQ